MLHEFLQANRSELIERCRAKVAKRSAPRATVFEIEHGIPLFLDQLIVTLRRDNAVRVARSATPEFGQLIAGPWVPWEESDIETSASQHGEDLLRRGFTVDLVVHDYGDLCQAITELAGELNLDISPEEFQVLNGSLDNAIAEAVSAFGRQRDRIVSDQGDRDMNERLGELAHELRNHLGTAILAFGAIKHGKAALQGATAGVLDRSLVALRDLVDRSLVDVRLTAGLMPRLEPVALAQVIADAQRSSSLDRLADGRTLEVLTVDPALMLATDRQLLHSALSNLLQNAFKFTHRDTGVTLRTLATDDRIVIEVEDRCGGLTAQAMESMFEPFTQHTANCSGIGLGLSISQRAVEAIGGKLTVRNLRGSGCVMCIDLPRMREGEVGDPARQESAPPSG